MLIFALSDAVTVSIVTSGFQNCKMWDPAVRGTSISALEHLQFTRPKGRKDSVPRMLNWSLC